MAKTKATFVCQNCGANSPKWIGKCPSCNEWNSYVEEVVKKVSKANPNPVSNRQAPPVELSLVKPTSQDRYILEDRELNQVLGGGLVPGSIVLLGGEPGIGKSTLSLQVAKDFKGKVLYISGEESPEQIKMRSDRLLGKADDLFVFGETSSSEILRQMAEIEPQMVVIDSVQTIHSELVESAPGSVSQIRQATAEIIQYAKQRSIPVILIGHITKDGQIAGPKVLEHMVDVVLQFEGDRHHLFRLLRSMKNRFGSTNELGIYEMKNEGLIAVESPSKVLISDREEGLSGIAIAASMEGMRPMLIETQALVSTAAYGTPQRSATGFDLRRLNMLLAVLEKRCGFKLSKKDVFLNMAGGISVEDPAIDLAVMAAILSSNVDIALPMQNVYCAEVGLSGELRPVSRIEQRLKEAEKLGFERFYASEHNLSGLNRGAYKLEIHGFKRIDELFKHQLSSAVSSE